MGNRESRVTTHAGASDVPTSPLLPRREPDGLAVHVAHWRLLHTTEGSRLIVGVGFFSMASRAGVLSLVHCRGTTLGDGRDHGNDCRQLGS